jgi:orotate phosphoribosyltransferase
MLSEKKTKQIFVKTKALLQGHFILSSGLRSGQYLQCAKLLMHPKQSELICKSLAQKIKKIFKNIDLVVAPAMGGIIVGYEVARHLKVPSIFTERVSGEFQLRRGFEIKPGAKILIVEDVITTGKSSMECAEVIKKHKGKVVGFACIVDRSNNQSVINLKIASQITFNIPTYREDQLPDKLKSIPAIKPGSRNLV